MSIQKTIYVSRAEAERKYIANKLEAYEEKLELTVGDIPNEQIEEYIEEEYRNYMIEETSNE